MCSVPAVLVLGHSELDEAVQFIGQTRKKGRGNMKWQMHHKHKVLDFHRSGTALFGVGMEGFLETPELS